MSSELFADDFTPEQRTQAEKFTSLLMNSAAEFRDRAMAWLDSYKKAGAKIPWSQMESLIKCPSEFLFTMLEAFAGDLEIFDAR
jgi:hypothetical protein